MARQDGCIQAGTPSSREAGEGQRLRLDKPFYKNG